MLEMQIDAFPFEFQELKDLKINTFNLFIGLNEKVDKVSFCFEKIIKIPLKKNRTVCGSE